MFKHIPGYEGIYEADESGVIRTVEGKQTHSVIRGMRTWKQRVLKQKTDKNGYKRVTLYKDKKPKTWLVHRLIAITFLEPNVGQNIINHIDGNPANNHVSNLEWCDYKHNSNHAFDNGLIGTGIKTKLVNLKTGEEHVFRSQSTASVFLGFGEKKISDLVQKNIKQIGDYKIVILKDEVEK